MEWILAIASLASAVAAVLAWAAKLAWSKEYSAAKDETIRAKDAQIQMLRVEIESYKELTPMKIREYFSSVKVQLEEYNDALKTQLEEARAEIEEKRDQIRELSRTGEERGERMSQLSREKRELEDRARTLSSELANLRQKQAEEEAATIKIPRLDPAAFKNIAESSRALSEALQKGGLWQEQIGRISESLSVSFRTWQELSAERLLFPDATSDEDTLVEWFLSEYEDPAENVPYESAEGGYQYFENEPHDAEEVLRNRFPEADDKVIKKAVDALEGMSSEWVRKDRLH